MKAMMRKLMKKSQKIHFIFSKQHNKGRHPKKIKKHYILLECKIGFILISNLRL